MRGTCSHLESNSFMLAAAVRVGTECCISMHELLSLIRSNGQRAKYVLGRQQKALFVHKLGIEHLTLMGLATGDGGSLQGKKLKSCISKACESSHLATSEPLASSTPLNIMLSVALTDHIRTTHSL